VPILLAPLPSSLISPLSISSLSTGETLKFKPAVLSTEEREMQECTFQPAISEKAKEAAARNKMAGCTIYEQLHSSGKESEMKREQLLVQEMRSHTFKPELKSDNTKWLKAAEKREKRSREEAAATRRKNNGASGASGASGAAVEGEGEGGGEEEDDLPVGRERSESVYDRLNAKSTETMKHSPNASYDKELTEEALIIALDVGAAAAKAIDEAGGDPTACMRAAAHAASMLILGDGGGVDQAAEIAGRATKKAGFKATDEDVEAAEQVVYSCMKSSRFKLKGRALALALERAYDESVSKKPEEYSYKPNTVWGKTAPKSKKDIFERLITHAKESSKKKEDFSKAAKSKGW
jgi:hypothetical protein